MAGRLKILSWLATLATVAAIAVCLPVPEAQTATRVSIRPSSGPVGLDPVISSASPCPQAPGGAPSYVLVRQEATGWLFRADLDSNGGWSMVPFGANMAAGSTQTFTATCTYDANGSRVTTASYGASSFKVSGSRPEVKLSASKIAYGDKVRVTSSTPCPAGGELVQDTASRPGNGLSYDNDVHADKDGFFASEFDFGLFVPDLEPADYSIDVLCKNDLTDSARSVVPWLGYAPATVRVSPPAPVSTRYLALGDSVPYGHGLANPTKGEKNGLDPDQGPSSKAYPSRVADALDLTLKNRPTGCSLTGPKAKTYDNLAVSGAPVARNGWTGKDDDCRYAKGVPVPLHKAVVPEETAAASLAARPPALVTIQAGADDIDFAGCLTAILGVPSQLGGHNCVTTVDGHYEMTEEAQHELESAQTGLLSTINGIHRLAPKAQILLLDYYQILPAAGSRVSGSSVICRDLRAAAPSSDYRTSIRAQAEFAQDQLNSMIREVAARYPDVALVELQDAFDGKEMCRESSVVYDGVWRAAHPTSDGHKIIAKAIEQKCKALPKKCRGR